MSEAEFQRYLREIERLRPVGTGTGAGRGPENLIVLERVASTNGLARSIAVEYEKEGQDLEPLLILAFEQSGGRGRQGRQWMSPRGQGVYATRVLSVTDPEMLQTLPLLVGVGLCRALGAHLGSPCRLKWPNDLLVETGGGRRKIGGILIEALVRPGEGAAAFIGFGVNHGHSVEVLPTGATSLHLERAGQAAGAGLEALTWDLVAGLEAELSHLGDVGYAVNSYRSWSVHQPGERLTCRVGDSVAEGTFAGFDDAGRLLLRTSEGEVRLSAGEVIEP
ncbi:MAG TPA: biotin--[acetyl-CoA-carboxylase] ligase [Thermoanaerobaculia bacterium]|nr:biotin--[acetyl-CoA-carboxylase] ligase [Thermoanaerobaculia bacterium]